MADFVLEGKRIIRRIHGVYLKCHYQTCWLPERGSLLYYSYSCQWRKDSSGFIRVFTAFQTSSLVDIFAFHIEWKAKENRPDSKRGHISCTSATANVDWCIDKRTLVLVFYFLHACVSNFKTNNVPANVDLFKKWTFRKCLSCWWFFSHLYLPSI